MKIAHLITHTFAVPVMLALIPGRIMRGLETDDAIRSREMCPSCHA